MASIQQICRSRTVRVALAGTLIVLGAMEFAPYIFNHVSTQAAINAPLIRLNAASDGTVATLPPSGYFLLKPMSIKLIDLSRNTGEVAELSAQAEIAQSRMALAKRQIAELLAQNDRLKGRAALFSSETIMNLAAETDAARAMLAGCKADQTHFHAALERAITLRQQGFMSAAGLEKARADSALKDSECRGDEAALRSVQIKGGAAQSGVFIGDSYNDAPYAVQQADRLMLQRQELEKMLSDATAQLTQAKLRLKDAVARASFAAPAGTLVWSTAASSGAAVRAGDPVIDLVDCARRFVQASLPESEADAIDRGAIADVRLIGSGKWMKGTVVDISGAASRRPDELLAVPTNLLLTERRIIVNVALPVPLPEQLDASHRCDIGRMAEVRFSRGI